MLLSIAGYFLVAALAMLAAVQQHAFAYEVNGEAAEGVVDTVKSDGIQLVKDFSSFVHDMIGGLIQVFRVLK